MIKNIIIGNIQEDQNCYIPNDPHNYLHSKKVFDQAYSKDETLKFIHDVANEEKANDLKCESSLYKYNSTQNIGSIGNYSNESSNKESCNSEMNGEAMQEDNASLQHSYGHMHNDIKNNYDMDDEISVLVERNKMVTSFDNDLFIDEIPNGRDDKSIGNNSINNSNVDAQRLNKDSHNTIVWKSNNDYYEQRNEKFIEDGKQNGPYNEQNYQTDSNLKGNDYNHKQYSDRERSNFRDTNIYPLSYNKINNRFARRRFEDFRGRRHFNDRDMSHTRESKFQDFRRHAYHSTRPHQQMLPRRTKFNEHRYNMSHTRYGNELHGFRDSRKKKRFSDGINSFLDARENHKTESQQSSPSIHREVPQIHHSRKRSRRSTSHKSDEDDKDFHRESPPIDAEKSPKSGFSGCRNRRFHVGSSGLGGYSPRRRRSETAIKTPSPSPRSPDRRKTRAWDLVPIGIDSKAVAAIATAHTAQQVVAKQVSTLSSISPLVSMNIINPTNNINLASNATLSSIIPSILHQVNPPLTTVTLTQATRSIRRLYVGNVPSTVSDGELMEFMNAAMLSANANHIPGSKPCINCIVSFPTNSISMIILIL